MNSFEKIIRGGLGVLLVSSLGAAACSQKKVVEAAPAGLDPEAVITAVAQADTAIILPLKKCPDVPLVKAPLPVPGSEPVEARQVFMPSVEIAQAYVGNPDQKDDQGNLANLHAAYVTAQYIVNSEKSISVYCGPDNHANGAPFEGVMIVSATAPGLITH